MTAISKAELHGRWTEFFVNLPEDELQALAEKYHVSSNCRETIVRGLCRVAEGMLASRQPCSSLSRRPKSSDDTLYVVEVLQSLPDDLILTSCIREAVSDLEPSRVRTLLQAIRKAMSDGREHESESVR